MFASLHKQVSLDVSIVRGYRKACFFLILLLKDICTHAIIHDYCVLFGSIITNTGKICQSAQSLSHRYDLQLDLPLTG